MTLLVWYGPRQNAAGADLESWRAQDRGRSFAIVHDMIADEWAASVKVGSKPARIFDEIVHGLDACQALCERKRMN